jgi:alpha-ribazole phosphatase
MRHGETSAHGRYCGSTDVLLSELGWQQMWSAVQGTCWDRIVSSPLRRCRDFAAALAQRRDLPLTEDSRLRELHFGDWEGRSAVELFKRSPDAQLRFWKDPMAHPPPGAERLQDARERVMACWHDLESACAGGRALIVTHGGPMRILRAEITALPIPRLFEIEVPYAALWDMRAWQHPSPA